MTNTKTGHTLTWQHDFLKLTEGDFRAATILSWLAFWQNYNRHHGKNKHDGRHWVYHTAEDIAREFEPATSKQVYASLRKLEKMGIIEARFLSENKHDRTKYYTVLHLENRPQSQQKPISSNGKMENPNSENVISSNGKMYIVENKKETKETPPPGPKPGDQWYRNLPKSKRETPPTTQAADQLEKIDQVYRARNTTHRESCDRWNKLTQDERDEVYLMAPLIAKVRKAQQIPLKQLAVLCNPQLQHWLADMPWLDVFPILRRYYGGYPRLDEWMQMIKARTTEMVDGDLWFFPKPWIELEKKRYSLQQKAAE